MRVTHPLAAAGRCPFRTADLVELSALMDALRGPGHGPAEGVAGLMP
ncbi:MAG: hypothetical protein JWL99_2153 [Streptomyces oryziradicis]|nr:hypothetical protein [Actinacidiphila oryziradicis]